MEGSDAKAQVCVGPAGDYHPADNGNTERALKRRFCTLDAAARRHTLAVLDAAEGNISLAARVLGVNRRTLYRKLQRWGLSRRDLWAGLPTDDRGDSTPPFLHEHRGGSPQGGW